MSDDKLYKHNREVIESATRISIHPSVRDVAYTLQKIQSFYPNKTVKQCIEGFARWTLTRWASGIRLPEDLTKFLTDESFQNQTGNMLADWVRAQEKVVKEIF